LTDEENEGHGSEGRSSPHGRSLRPCHRCIKLLGARWRGGSGRVRGAAPYENVRILPWSPLPTLRSCTVHRATGKRPCTGAKTGSDWRVPGADTAELPRGLAVTMRRVHSWD
jgi:hypothetical protein